MSYPERFADYKRHCGAETGDDEWCDAELTFSENYAGMRHMPNYEGKVHALKCPKCGELQGVCPLCTGEDGGPGWYRGESTGDMLACHVCNHREYVAQRRDPHRP